MNDDRFDCIVVGARCAGAPLATHLARAGMRVCLLDAEPLPSDQPFSTHAIQVPGVDLLDELGVGSELRRLAPPVRLARFSVGGTHMDIEFPPERPMYCPRRTGLDKLLQETAVSAGAELRDRTAVTGLLWDDGRVVGVRAKHNGTTSSLYARNVVGADGRNSTVARQVKAEEYLVGSAPRGGYWAYFQKSALWGQGDWPFGTYIGIDGHDARFVFETGDDLLIMGGMTEASAVAGWTGDPLGSMRRFLEASPVTGPLIEARAPIAPPVGLRKLRYFFRVARGPGWALVGDAGLHKDPTPGYGITDALRDAKALAGALLDGRAEALDVYWRERDVLSISLFFQAEDMSALGFDNAFNRLIFGRINATPALVPRIHEVMDRKRSPYDMVPLGSAVGWLLRELFRGRFSLLPLFFNAGQRGAWVSAELKRRQRELDKARENLARAPSSA
jgi:menaquinone-9 beta-reductase